MRSGLVGFEPATGKVDFHFPWRAKILESVNASTSVVVGDEVFISETYGPGSALLQVESGGSRVVWRDEDRRREKAMQTHWNTAVYHDGFLYGSSGRHESNAELRCVEWKTGEVKWSQPGLSRCSLLYVDGHLVCLGEDGVLRLLRADPEKFDVVETLLLEAKEGVNFFTGRRPQLLKPPLLGRACLVSRTALPPRQRPTGLPGTHSSATGVRLAGQRPDLNGRADVGNIDHLANRRAGRCGRTGSRRVMAFDSPLQHPPRPFPSKYRAAGIVHQTHDFKPTPRRNRFSISDLWDSHVGMTGNERIFVARRRRLLVSGLAPASCAISQLAEIVARPSISRSGRIRTLSK